MEEKRVESSHVFLFPFNWNYIGNYNFKNFDIYERINLDKFKCLLKDSWEEQDFKKCDSNDVYNEYSYYYDNVRKAIFTYGNQKVVTNKIKYNLGNKKRKLFRRKIKYSNNVLVRNFNYKNKDGDSENLGKYIIKIRNKDKEDEQYELEIKRITLKTYTTGIGILSFFLDNYKYNNEEEILKINEYGRRIYPQFLGIDDVKDSFLADELCIKFNDEEQICDNFGKKDNEYYQNYIKISCIITKLLGESFTINNNLNISNKICIKPIIDDRMFTMCWYVNTWKANYLSSDSSGELNYLNDEFWYKLMFIDGKDITCPNNTMMKDLIKNATYERWTNCGTFYGVTRYSFVIMGKDTDFFNNILLKHFKTIYYEMVCLALLQRASILRFSEEVTLVLQFNNKFLVERLNDLHKKYIEFINELYFREVTAQEQGIEIYNKLTSCMKIERDISKLDNEIGELQQSAVLEADKQTNISLNIITIIGMILAFASFLVSFFEMNPLKNMLSKYHYNVGKLVFTCMILPCVAFGILLHMYKKKRIKKIIYVIGIVAISIVIMLLSKVHF